MGQWWGPELHREHERKILASLCQVFESRYRCPKNRECYPHFRILWLSRWEEFRDGHGRVRVLVDCFCDSVSDTFDTDVTRQGEIVSRTQLPIAA